MVLFYHRVYDTAIHGEWKKLEDRQTWIIFTSIDHLRKPWPDEVLSGKVTGTKVISLMASYAESYYIVKKLFKK